MKASPLTIIKSFLGPDQTAALLRSGLPTETLARTLVEASAPADLGQALQDAGLEKAEPLSARTVLAVQNLVRLNQMRADRAIREVALGKAEKKQASKKDDRRRQFWQDTQKAEQIRYNMSEPDEYGDRHFRVYALHPSEGLIGELNTVHFKDGGKHQVYDIGIHKNFRRQGLATRLMNEAERIVGVRLMPGDDQSDDAVAFWEKRKQINKAERSPKLPPDQKGVGLPHPAAPKLAPTKQLDPRVKPNRGAKRRQFALGKAEPSWQERGHRSIMRHPNGLYEVVRSQNRMGEEPAHLFLNNKHIGKYADVEQAKTAAQDHAVGQLSKSWVTLDQLRQTPAQDDKQWRNRPILRHEDARDLDHAAAARAISSGSAGEGERLAYEEYSRRNRLDAMAHHHRQAGEAQARGDHQTARRHLLAYAGHARAIGADPTGQPPPEVGERIRQLEGKRAPFRGHAADRL